MLVEDVLGNATEGSSCAAVATATTTGFVILLRSVSDIGNFASREAVEGALSVSESGETSMRGRRGSGSAIVEMMS